MSLEPTSSSSTASASRAIMDSIRRIVHALQVSSRAAQKTLGLSSAQLFVLQTLASNGVLSVNDLAARSHTHQSSVSVVVARLLDAGLVSRTCAEADSRRAEISVSSAGRRLLRSPIVTPQQRLIASLQELSPAKLRQLQALLEEWINASGLDSDSPPMFFEETAQERPARKRTVSPASPRPTKKSRA